MEDKFKGVDKERMFKVLDKVTNVLSGKLQSQKFYLKKSHQYDGGVSRMKISLYSRDYRYADCSYKVLSFNTDLTNGSVTVLFYNRSLDELHIATMYKDNSESCKNFVEQVQIEEDKISAMLDDLLKELDEIKPEEKKPEEKKPEKKKEIETPSWVKRQIDNIFKGSLGKK